MKDIKDFSLEELTQTLVGCKYEGYHAKQIFSWVYKRRGKDFNAMSDLSSKLRKMLNENFYLFGLDLIRMLKSKDGTEKFLFKLKDENFIETVIIPTEKRSTVCLSTQVGCKFGCRFCASGMFGFRRNLTCGEMIEQVLYLKENTEKYLFNADMCRLHTDNRRLKFHLRESAFPAQSSLSSVRDPASNLSERREDLRESAFKRSYSSSLKRKNITHLVFMGIGEPLDNYDNVIKAIRIINSAFGLNIGARRITISTCGIIPGIKRLVDEGLQIELSVSIHAADDKTRSQLMPVNRIYPLKDLIIACREYIKKTNRQITFEYVLIKGINSGLQNARNLSTILKDLKLCKVNLLPANPVEEFKVEPPNKLEILLFRDFLLKSGIDVTLRRPRGGDIDAACGQLRLRYEKN